MGSTKEYLEFVLDQLSGAGSVSSRPMMGEYLLYCRGKLFGGIYDDRFLVKETPAAVRLMPDAEREIPYEGAKEMLLVDNVDDRDFLSDLVLAMAEELPEPKLSMRGPAKKGNRTEKTESIEVTVRPAEPADADAILAMLSQILELHAKLRPDLFRTGATKYSKEEILEILGNPERRSFVAAGPDGAVLGYALCILRDQPGSRVALPYTSLYVDDLCVDETCRGRSVGRKLFEAAKAEAKALGCYELNLVVWEGNDRARAFYDKMGMKPKETMMELIL